MSLPIEVVSAISGAIAGGIVSCVFSYFNDRRKERRADEKDAEKERQRRFENRPEFKIIKFQTGSKYTEEDSREQRLQAVTAEFNPSIEEGLVYANFSAEELDKSEWVSVRYVLENVGKTDVSSISLICQDKRHFWLCDKYLADDLIKSRVLHYVAYFDNKVRVGETFEIEVFYNKNHSYLPMLDIGMETPDVHFWKQPLFLAHNKVGDSGEIDYRDYLDAIKTEVAEECFKNPWLW